MTYDWDGKRTRQLKIIQSVAVGMTFVAACAAFAALLKIALDLS
ncbi:hypothetical protein [Rhizobium sp. 9140]|nr:hypothetical protein [Rhizobium sp. 9140]CZT36239.1 hypothetical protein GA0004734_00032390 [Rhizobium sp. 9140]